MPETIHADEPPEPATIEVARRFLHGGVEQQEHNAFSPPLKSPDVEDVRREMHSFDLVCSDGAVMWEVPEQVEEGAATHC
jgi:hypothetical protein